MKYTKNDMYTWKGALAMGIFATTCFSSLNADGANYNFGLDDEFIPISENGEIKKGSYDARGPYYAKTAKDPNRLFFVSIEGDIGYRSDQYKWDFRAFDAPDIKNSDSKVRNTNIFEVGAILKFYISNLFIGGQGGWGRICDGDNTIKIRATAFFPPPSATFHGSVRGHVEDYSAFLGYDFRLFSKGSHRLFLVPEVGYQWNFQSYYDKNVHPASALTNPSTDPSGIITDLHMTFDPIKTKMRWNGPFVGLSFLYQFQKWDFEVGGTYEWLNEHFYSKFQLMLSGAAAGFPLSFNSLGKATGEFDSDYAYSAFLNLHYHLASHWILGLSGFYRQVQAENGHITNHVLVDIQLPGMPEEIDTVKTRNKSTNSWNTWSATFNIAYLF